MKAALFFTAGAVLGVIGAAAFGLWLFQDSIPRDDENRVGSGPIPMPRDKKV